MGAQSTAVAKGLKPTQVFREIINSFLRGSHLSSKHDNFLDSYLTTKDNGEDDEASDRLKFVRDFKSFITEQEAAEISAWKCQESGGGFEVSLQGLPQLLQRIFHQRKHVSASSQPGERY